MSTTNKWMKTLTSDFGKAAELLPSFKEMTIPTPSPSLNWALSGGFVESKAYLFYGPEQSGKSLLSQLGLIEIQKKFPESIQIVFDAEYSFNKDWFVKLGGDPTRVVVRQTNDPVKIFDYMWTEMLEALQEGAPIKAVMIDSIKSILYPKDLKKVSTDFVQGGTGANYLPSALKRILPVLREYHITSFAVQQVSENMDMYTKARNPYVLPDGRSLKHWADLMLQVDKIETKDTIVSRNEDITGNDLQIGHKVRVKVKKNRTGAPARVAQFTLDYEKGIINKEREILDLAKSLNIMRHPENPETGLENKLYWVFGNYDQVKGEENFVKWATSTPGMIDEVYAACLGSEVVPQTVDDDTLLSDIEG
jgi:recombination protein RecA